MKRISATQIYDHVACPHRVFLDAHGDTSLRDDADPFVEMLWEQGVDHEADTIKGLGITADMSLVPVGQRERETLAAMARHEHLIYQGRLTAGDLVGEPDLLKWCGNGYQPGDIKSGSGLEGDEDMGKLKKHYAVQVAHYVNILELLKLDDGSRESFIIDRQGNTVPYLLNARQGVRNPTSWWEMYLVSLEEVRAAIARTKTTLGALNSVCKLCHWGTHCKKTVIADNDLSLICELGRSKRDKMVSLIPTVRALADCRIEDFFVGKAKKTVFDGIGQDTLKKYQARAILLSTPGAKPYLKETVHFPVSPNEVFFDIEADPMRDVVYLHGFVERIHGRPETERFIAFFADGIEAEHEEETFRQAWEYLMARLSDSTIFYYSKYERTAYRKLAELYPSVCSVDDINDAFSRPVMVDLYTDVVKKATEWPTYDQSIKTLAKYQGFSWRDHSPSGAASIEWYSRWIETGDLSIKNRILEYNEDDCKATGIVVDGVKQLTQKSK